MQRPPFPHTIDSTMLKTFRECPRKFELEYLHHWKSTSPSIHLHAGAAFASALEVARRAFYVENQPVTDAVQAGVNTLIKEYSSIEIHHDTAKTLDRMCGALLFYFDNYPMDRDPMTPYEFSPGKKAIEFTFAAPLPFIHPVTETAILYSGRADMIANFQGGLFVVDEKTTTSLGASWSSQWDMRSQFTGYAWAAKFAAIPVDGTIIRGVSILKTKYETQQVITYRPQWMIDRWLEQTVRDLTRMERMWEEGYFDYNLDEACNGYSGCLFRRVCLSPNPEEWLPTYYEQRVWNPLTREETIPVPAAG